MKKIFLILILFLFTVPVNAHPADCDMPLKQRPLFSESKNLDEFLDSRLHFTQEQKNYIKKNRPKYKSEISKVLKEMQKLHDEIKNEYLTGIPRYQADLKTAPKKAQLAILRKNAKQIREKHRKAFENILDENQKIEFEKIKQEFSKKPN